MSISGFYTTSSYKMSLQSVNSQISELSKSGSTSDVSLRSALKQQASALQGQISYIENSNNEYLKQNFSGSSFNKSPYKSYAYNKDGDQLSASSVGSTFDQTI